MKPIDPADAHLKDSVLELRILITALVVFALAVASVLYPWPIVFGIFTVLYLGYKYHYYRERVGAFTTEDLPIRHNKLEYGIVLAVAFLVGKYAITETIFMEEWEGGELGLPVVDFTDYAALMENPEVLMGWATVAAPFVLASYAVFQFRHRLLFGLNTPDAAIRAAIWETLARVPVFLAWVAIITFGPVFDLWQRVPEELGDSLGTSGELTGEFSVVFGDSILAVLSIGVLVPAVVIVSFVTVQLLKYDDATIPELFGYRGFGCPNWQFHKANIAVPVGVLTLYSVVVLALFDVPDDVHPGLAAGVVVSILIGTNAMGKTTEIVESLPGATQDIDAVVTGFLAGVVALLAVGSAVESELAISATTLLYPAVALPLTYAGNRAVGKYTEGNIEDFVQEIEADPQGFDQEMVDRLFVYSRSRDDSLRAAAIDGLASAVQVSEYKKYEALDVFAEAIETNNERVVRSGFNGLIAIMSYDRSPAVRERLQAGNVSTWAVPYLDSDDDETKLLATKALAYLYTISLDTTEPLSVEELAETGFEQMGATAHDYPEDGYLQSAVTEYYATLWYKLAMAEPTEADITRSPPQELLGTLLELPKRVPWIPRMKAAIAVSSSRAVADEQRHDRAIENLDEESEDVRFIGMHVIRSSMDRHRGRLDGHQLVGLLDDPSPAVSKTAAEAIVAYVSYSPEAGEEILDDLVAYLEANQVDPRMAEGAVIRALTRLNTEKLQDHPSIVGTVAGFVDEPRTAVAEPAATLLAAFVRADPSVGSQPAVGDAIEAGLVHTHDPVRLQSLRAVVGVVHGSIEEGRRYVPGLADNLDRTGEHGVLAAVSLIQLLEEYPEDGIEQLDRLADGLGNLTAIDRQEVPFVVRGNTVTDVVVDAIANVITLDPARGTDLIPPLMNLVTSTEGTTLKRIYEILAILSAEYPDRVKPVVEDAAFAIQEGRVGIRAAATNVLGNIAVEYPGTVEPFTDRLLIATDDDNPRVRSLALRALTNVCAEFPTSIETDIHRVVGRLDDDSAEVREQAARLMVTIADQTPDIIEPAAETADRLRRLQRDPAIDFDSGQLQDASVAIQTGVSQDAGAGAAVDGDIQSPETSDEMGVSGDTNIFDPSEGDFGGDFDAGDFDPDGSNTVMDPDEKTIEPDPVEETTSIGGPPESADESGDDSAGEPAGPEVPDIDIDEQEVEASEAESADGSDGADGESVGAPDDAVDDGAGKKGGEVAGQEGDETAEHDAGDESEDGVGDGPPEDDEGETAEVEADTDITTGEKSDDMSTEEVDDGGFAADDGVAWQSGAELQQGSEDTGEPDSSGNHVDEDAADGSEEEMGGFSTVIRRDGDDEGDETEGEDSDSAADGNGATDFDPADDTATTEIVDPSGDQPNGEDANGSEDDGTGADDDAAAEASDEAVTRAVEEADDGTGDGAEDVAGDATDNEADAEDELGIGDASAPTRIMDSSDDEDDEDDEDE